MPNLHWSDLSAKQLGRYAEYYAKMEFASYAFEVFSSEVDDRGVDFVAKGKDGHFYEIQVKGVFRSKYIFFKKKAFVMRPNYYICLLVFKENLTPVTFLIPSTVWLSPNKLFISREYEGKKSAPEWAISLTKANEKMLANYRFEAVHAKL